MSLNHLVQPSPGSELDVTFANVAATGNVSVSGMLTASGGIESSGPLVELNSSGGPADAIGFFAPRDADFPGPDVYCGLVRDGASWYLLDDSSSAPPDADLGALGDLNVKGFAASGLAHISGDTIVDSDISAANVLTGGVVATEVETIGLSVADPSLSLNGFAVNQAGIGFSAPITPLAPGPQYYAGLMREAGDDGRWHLFDGVTLLPPADITSAHGDLEVDELKCRVLHRVEELKVDDPLFEINAAAADDSMAVGFYAQQIPVGPTYYTGLVREPTAKKWYLIDNSVFEPPNPGAYGSLGDFRVAEFKSDTGDASLFVSGSDILTGGTGSFHILNAAGLWLQNSSARITLERFTNGGEALVDITTDNTGEEWLFGAAVGDDDFTINTLVDTVVRLKQDKSAEFTGTINGAGLASGDLLVGDGAGAMATLPPGGDGELLTISGGSAAWVAPRMSFAQQFGGNALAAAGYFVSNGLPTSAVQAASNNFTISVLPVACTLQYITYSTSAGDATSQFEIYKNTVGQGAFLLPSPSTGFLATAISFAAGDVIELRWNNVGTVAALTLFNGYFQQTS